MWPGLALFLAGTSFLITESVVAAAWPAPGYSYVGDYISALELLHAPYGPVMSAAFILNGVLTAAAATAVLRKPPRESASQVLLILSWTYGVGIVTAGVFHGDTAPTVHGLGALCIPVGNLALIVLAWLLHQRGHHILTVTAAAAAGMVGLIGFVLVVMHSMVDQAGALERLAAYPNLFGQILVGIGVALGVRRRLADDIDNCQYR